MTKQPQSQIGYFVNGVLVLDPSKRHPPADDDKRAATKQRRARATITQRQQQQQKGKPPLMTRQDLVAFLQQKESHFKVTKGHRLKKRALSSNQRHGDYKIGTDEGQKQLFRALRFDSRMVDLKNACKQGNMIQAMIVSFSIAKDYFFPSSSSSSSSSCSFQMRDWIQTFFCKDLEGRSALYYAAHSGHDSMVETFLALWIVCVYQPQTLSYQRKIHPMKTRCTMMKWLGRLGFPKSFQKLHLQTCHLNALNQITRSVIDRRLYSIHDLRLIVQSSDWIPETIVDAGSTRKQLQYRFVAKQGMVEVLNNAKPATGQVQSPCSSTVRIKPALVMESETELYNDFALDDYDDEDEYTVEQESEYDEYEEDIRLSTHDGVEKMAVPSESVEHDDDSEVDDICLSLAIAASLEQGKRCLVIIEDAEDGSTDDDEFLDIEDVEDWFCIPSDEEEMDELALCVKGMTHQAADIRQEDAWSVLSSPDSVYSINTVNTQKTAATLDPSSIVSYKDAIVSSAKCQRPSILTSSTTPRLEEISETEVAKSKTGNEKKLLVQNAHKEEDENPNCFFAEYDMAKTGRGGKVARRFKGNARTPKH